MTTDTRDTATAYQSEMPTGKDGFAQLVWSEWTKFRTVRGWVVGTAVAVLLTLLVGVLAALGNHTSCAGVTGGTEGAGEPSGANDRCAANSPPVGPGGEVVTDSFYFVHQSLTGDGTITARLTSLTGLTPSNEPPPDDEPLGSAPQAGSDPLAGLESGVQPWTKAGVMVKATTTAGSAYAAMMVTGGNGVRMQSNYLDDIAGSPSAVSLDAPRWLRLTRTAETLVGEESPDGLSWTQVGTVNLAGLPATVQVGLFVASPEFEQTSQSLGGASSFGGPTQASGTFDKTSITGDWAADGSSAAGWIGQTVGSPPIPVTDFTNSGDTFIVTGSGDVAPAVSGPGGGTIERGLVGTFAGLIVVIVIASMFITTEYRRGLIRLTLAASPRRGRVLAAKSIVLAAVMFVAGVVTGAVGVWLLGAIRRQRGESIFPVGWLTELRVVVGTGLLFAVTAIFAVAVGTILRRSAGTVATVVVVVVLPYLLAVSSVLRGGPAEWLLRLTPAAGFAIQQSGQEYPQVNTAYIPPSGYFPLAPWAGFGVLCLWTVLALGLATVLLRRRDA